MKTDLFHQKYKINTQKTITEEIDNWIPYEHLDVFFRYTQNSYFEDINTALRTGVSESVSVIKDIEALDKLFKLVPNKLKNKTPIEIYRGAYLSPELKEILDGKATTDIYTEKAFVSTSKSRLVAKRFANSDDKVFFEITVPPNTTYIEDSMLPSGVGSAMRGEEEVLLPRNSQFKITGYNPKTKKVTAIYLGQKQPLEMPQMYQCSGFDILANINKVGLFDGKRKTSFDKKYNSKNKLY